MEKNIKDTAGGTKVEGTRRDSDHRLLCVDDDVL